MKVLRSRAEKAEQELAGVRIILEATQDAFLELQQENVLLKIKPSLAVARHNGKIVVVVLTWGDPVPWKMQVLSTPFEEHEEEP